MGDVVWIWWICDSMQLLLPHKSMSSEMTDQTLLHRDRMLQRGAEFQQTSDLSVGTPSTPSQNSQSDCDGNFSLMLESDIISMNCSSSEELRSSGAEAVNGSLTQSNCTVLSGRYF